MKDLVILCILKVSTFKSSNPVNADTVELGIYKPMMGTSYKTGNPVVLVALV